MVINHLLTGMILQVGEGRSTGGSTAGVALRLLPTVGLIPLPVAMRHGTCSGSRTEHMFLTRSDRAALNKQSTNQDLPLLEDHPKRVVL